MTRIKSLLFTLPLVAFVALAAAKPAGATTILVFGQAGIANTITITGAAGVTTITGTDVAVSITAIEGGVPVLAFLDLSATSVGAAALVGGDDQQHFSGTWSICSTAVGCAINYLSGTFSDLGTGAAGGAAFALNSATPSDTVTFTENSTITSTALERAVSFAFTNWTPGVAIVGGTIASATASIAGNFSGNIGQTVIPEPASMLLLGTGLLGLAVARRRLGRKNA